MLYLAIALLITIGWGAISLAPWVPARKQDLKRINTLANLKPGETFLELGCGNGRVISHIANKNNIKAIGLEIAFSFYLLCQLRKLLYKQDNINYKWKNLFLEDFSQADVLYFFGMPDKIRGKLTEKLETELKPGARVISYAFPIATWEPITIDHPTSKSVKIHLYQK